MEINGEPSWLPPQAWQSDQAPAENRPGTGASVASSTSSFRIPGITPTSRVHSQLHQPSVRPSTPTPSFVRLFTPQLDDPEALFRAHSADSTPPIDWLAREGPSPRELLESSQGPSAYLRASRSPPYITDGRRARPLAPPFAIDRPPGPDQADDELRPFTASSYHRSKLVTADGSVGSYVCAILENRGTGREVGIASIEHETGTSPLIDRLLTRTMKPAIQRFARPRLDH